MTAEKVNQLLDKALILLHALEESADEQTRMEIDALFNEVKYSDEIDDEMDMWRENGNESM